MLRDTEANPRRGSAHKQGRNRLTPLEEQVEKLARRWEKEADEGELLDEVAYALEGAADELRALLPLEVTDESVTVRLTVEEAGTLTEPRVHTIREAEVRGRARDKVRTAVRAALTQKGDNE